ncbi:MAG: hypothetical protein U9R24_00010 [Thermodesulfobacteriota bacterium]|nr:hypothetical protein [Thermodesulfobacteriota bacterium]
MGHLSGKELYQDLGEKIDGMMMRAPQNERFYAILRELYPAEELALSAIAFQTPCK